MKTQTGRFAVTCKLCKAHWTATLDPKVGQGLYAELGAMHHCERSDAYRNRIKSYATSPWEKIEGDHQVASVYFGVEPITHNPLGSQHKCSDKCRCAKGGACECSCKGMFHGVAYAA